MLHRCDCHGASCWKYTNSTVPFPSVLFHCTALLVAAAAAAVVVALKTMELLNLEQQRASFSTQINSTRYSTQPRKRKRGGDTTAGYRGSQQCRGNPPRSSRSVLNAEGSVQCAAVCSSVQQCAAVCSSVQLQRYEVRVVVCSCSGTRYA